MNQDTEKILTNIKAAGNYYALNEDEITSLVGSLEYCERNQDQMRKRYWKLYQEMRELGGKVKEFQKAMEEDDPSLRINVLKKSIEDDWRKYSKTWRTNRETADVHRVNALSKRAYIADLEKRAMGREKDRLAQRIGRQRKANKEMHRQIGRMRFVLRAIVDEVTESMGGKADIKGWKLSLQTIRNMANQVLEKGKKVDK
jgi:hypothetical protein